MSLAIIRLISILDYTQGGTKVNKPLQPLNTLFSYNNAVFMLFDDKLIKNIEKIKEKMNKEDKAKDKAIYEEEDDTPNKELVKIA